MEQRKLIKLGNSSFALALPKDWVENSGLKKGDDVYIVRNPGGEITLSPEYKKVNGNGKDYYIELDEKEETEIAREIIRSYIEGSHSITLSGDKQKLKKVKEISKRFLGLEIIEEKEKKIVLKDLLDYEGIGLDNLIQRANNDLSEMFNVIEDILKDKKISEKQIKEIQEIDRDINKVYFLVWRIMNSGVENPALQVKLKKEPKEFIINFWVCYNIEQIGDIIKNLVKSLKQNHLDNSFLYEVFKLIKLNYELCIKSFFQKDKELAKEVIFKKKEIIIACDKLSEMNGYEAISEKLSQTNINIHSNAKMIFYEF
jgi:phosphate uptake regulator